MRQYTSLPRDVLRNFLTPYPLLTLSKDLGLLALLSIRYNVPTLAPSDLSRYALCLTSSHVCHLLPLSDPEIKS